MVEIIDATTTAFNSVAHHTDGRIELTQSFGGAALDNQHDLATTAPTNTPGSTLG